MNRDIGDLYKKLKDKNAVTLVRIDKPDVEDPSVKDIPDMTIKYTEFDINTGTKVKETTKVIRKDELDEARRELVNELDRINREKDSIQAKIDALNELVADYIALPKKEKIDIIE